MYHFVETKDRESQEFIDFVIEVIKEHDIDVIMPVLQRGIVFFNNYRSELSELTEIGLMPKIDELEHVKYKDKMSKYLDEK